MKSPTRYSSRRAARGCGGRGGARRRRWNGERLGGERLERREVFTASNLLPTLDALKASASDVYYDNLDLNGQQTVTRQEVNIGGEVDLYGFTPAWTGTYRFTGDAYRSKIDPAIAVYAPDGQRIALNDDAGPRTRSSVATATLTAGLTYTFAVTSHDTSAVGRYSAGIAGVIQDDTYENNDSMPTARLLPSTSGAPLDAVMADAHDYFKFTIAAAARQGAFISAAFNESQGDLDLRLLDSKGAVLRVSDGEGDGEMIDVSGLMPGSYFVDVYGYRGAFNPAYRLSVDASAAAVTPILAGDSLEPNNTLAAAASLGTITSNTSWQDLSITKGDVDFYTFTLGSAGTAASEVLLDFVQRQGDIDAELLDAAGTRIAISQTTSNQERFSLNGLGPGTYAIRVYGYSGAANPRYSLTINHVVGITVPVTPPTVGPGIGSWTVMIYMTSTNLASYGFKDVNEMEDALTRVAPGVRFTLFWDQWNQSSFATGGGSQSAWGTAGRAILQADANMNSVATTFDVIGERNTGDPATLRDFITWSKINAAADNYALVMWNHGGGLSGVNFDDESSNDSITVGDLRSAIMQAGVPLQVLSYDACLMGMAEQAYETRGLASVIVASEEIIDGPGYDYKTAFQSLNSNPADVTAQALAQGMVSSFSAAYVADGVSTYSAVSTAAMDGVATNLKAFTSAAVALSAVNVITIRGILAGVTHFDFPEYIDLQQFMQRISTSATLPAGVRTAATNVVAAVNQAVFAKMADARKTGGLAIYLPSTAAQESSSYGLFSSFESATQWGSFINRVLGRATITRLGAGVGLSNAAASRSAGDSPGGLGTSAFPTTGGRPSPTPQQAAAVAVFERLGAAVEARRLQVTRRLVPPAAPGS